MNRAASDLTRDADDWLNIGEVGGTVDAGLRGHCVDQSVEACRRRARRPHRLGGLLDWDDPGAVLRDPAPPARASGERALVRSDRVRRGRGGRIRRVLRRRITTARTPSGRGPASSCTVVTPRLPSLSPASSLSASSSPMRFNMGAANSPSTSPLLILQRTFRSVMTTRSRHSRREVPRCSSQREDGGAFSRDVVFRREELVRYDGAVSFRTSFDRRDGPSPT